jgi:hypothetical protein
MTRPMASRSQSGRIGVFVRGTVKNCATHVPRCETERSSDECRT